MPKIKTKNRTFYYKETRSDDLAVFVSPGPEGKNGPEITLIGREDRLPVLYE